MANDGRTIYGFVRGEESHSFGGIGLEGTEVYTLSHENISALISRHGQTGFNDLPKETVLRNLTVYQSVIEQVMTAQSVIPVKFGTFIERDEGVIRILKRGKDEIAQCLKEMENKIELDVVVLWPDINVVLAEIAQTDEIKALKEKASEQPEKDALEMRIRAGKRVKALLDHKRESIQSVIIPSLLSMAEKHCLHDLMDDSMIMNAAFLIDREDAARLEGVVAGLDRHYEDTLNFRMIGPLPPYSFRTLEVKTVDYEKLNNARKLLGLKEQTTQQEIREHYWQLSKKFHPDKFPGDRDAQKHFEKINHAYKLVTDYCREPSCSFREEDVKNWVFLKAVGG
ncbi:MAG TPA: GvpL/GvpF family gas vesicle protein [Desulfobacteria bacterium]|nr:GvpL/GvpF family gas vesicle protein [Desulfobacteria bacterium]